MASGGWRRRCAPGSATPTRRLASRSTTPYWPSRPSGERDRQDQERDRESKDDFSDSWRTYRERADHIRQTYGWRVPQPPPLAIHWLPLGRDDDQEHDQPPDPPRRWLGEERDSDREHP